jgi:hypothetical protein
MPGRFIDPLASDAAWPEGSGVCRGFVEAAARAGSTVLVANLRTRLLGFTDGRAALPVSINTAEYGDAWVCLPHSVYALYLEAEIGRMPAGLARALGGAATSGLDALLRAAQVNRVVQLNSWLLSTNPEAGLDPSMAEAFRAAAIDAFPGHLLSIRGIRPGGAVDPAALAAAGWRLIPSRRVWLVEDLARAWRPRRDVRRDLALLAAGPQRVETLERIGEDEAERIAALYRDLYLGRHGALNPAYGAAFVRLSHELGLIRYRVLRDPEGAICAFAGVMTSAGVVSTPLLGYDLKRPREAGLYRKAMAVSGLAAEEAGLPLHWSAGAAAFKRARGARPVMEHTAFWDRHLPPPRRAAMAMLHGLVSGVIAPEIERRGL